MNGCSSNIQCRYDVAVVLSEPYTQLLIGGGLCYKTTNTHGAFAWQPSFIAQHEGAHSSWLSPSPSCRSASLHDDTITKQVLVVLSCGLWLHSEECIPMIALWTNLQWPGRRAGSRSCRTHRGVARRPFSLADGKDSSALCSTCDERKKKFCKRFKM